MIVCFKINLVLLSQKFLSTAGGGLFLSKQVFAHRESALWWTKYVTSTEIIWLKGVSPVSSFLFTFLLVGHLKIQNQYISNYIDHIDILGSIRQFKLLYPLIC